MDSGSVAGSSLEATEMTESSVLWTVRTRGRFGSRSADGEGEGVGDDEGPGDAAPLESARTKRSMAGSSFSPVRVLRLVPRAFLRTAATMLL